MKKKNDYKLLIKSLLIVFITGIITLFTIVMLFKKDNKIDNDYYYLSFDESWRIVNDSKERVLLKHGSGSQIEIQITNLKDESEYLSIGDIIDEVIYSILKQNNKYKLIAKDNKIINSDEINGYKLLFENDNEQVMMGIYKKMDKLICIKYEAKNEYFDILLDSVNNIIYKFSVKDEKIDLNSKLNIKLSNIELSTGSDFDNLLKETKNDTIANYNYLIDYSIPNIFSLSQINSQTKNYTYKNDSGSVEISTSILLRNIYDYLSLDDTRGVYNSYKVYHDEEHKEYSNYEEYVMKLDNKKGYMYYNKYYNQTYKTDKDFNKVEYKRLDENMELIYSIDNNHIFIVKIKSYGIPISNRLLNMIKINSNKNYSSYIVNEKDNDYIISELKDFTNYEKNRVRIIKLRLPIKYSEIDKGSNIYSDRYYVNNYNKETDLYDYEVHYLLSTLEPDKQVSVYSFPTIRGKYSKYKFIKNFISNGKEFKVYSGWYTELSGVMFTNVNRKEYYKNKVLIGYKVSDGKYLYIEITGNGKDIKDDIMKELSNFIIEEKEY